MTVIPNFTADQPTEMSAAWLKRVVGAVCSESVSAEFPIKQGNNREFLRIQAISDLQRTGKQLILPGNLDKFSRRRSRKIFGRTGRFLVISGKYIC